MFDHECSNRRRSSPLLPFLLGKYEERDSLTAGGKNKTGIDEAPLRRCLNIKLQINSCLTGICLLKKPFPEVATRWGFESHYDVRRLIPRSPSLQPRLEHLARNRGASITCTLATSRREAVERMFVFKRRA